MLWFLCREKLEYDEDVRLSLEEMNRESNDSLQIFREIFEFGKVKRSVEYSIGEGRSLTHCDTGSYLYRPF